MATPTDKEKKQVMDVAKPGSTGATPNARPIIVGHGGMMKDPMVTAQPPAESVTEVEKPAETETPPTPATTSDSEGPLKPATLPSHKVIQPVSATVMQSTDKAPAAEAAGEAGKQTESSDAAPESSEEAVVDAVIDQVGGKKKDGHQTEEEKKQQEALEKLITDKTYFIPISDTRTKRNGKIILTLLTVLLATIIGLAAAVDAGAIDPGFKLPFDFIKDKTSQPAPVVSSTPTPATPVQPPAPATVTSKLSKLSFSYPSDWKLEGAIAEKYVTGTSPDETITLTSPSGTKFKYVLLDDDPKLKMSTSQKFSCGVQSVCSVYVVNAVRELDLKNIGKTQLIELGTNKKGEVDSKHPYTSGYTMELTIPESQAVTLKVGENTFKDYGVNFTIPGQGKDRLHFFVVFPESYDTKTPAEVFSSADAKAAIKIFESISVSTPQ